MPALPKDVCVGSPALARSINVTLAPDLLSSSAQLTPVMPEPITITDCFIFFIISIKPT